jgi:hypothetical protein
VLIRDDVQIKVRLDRIMLQFGISGVHTRSERSSKRIFSGKSAENASAPDKMRSGIFSGCMSADKLRTWSISKSCVRIAGKVSPFVVMATTAVAVSGVTAMHVVEPSLCVPSRAL